MGTNGTLPEEVWWVLPRGAAAAAGLVAPPRFLLVGKEPGAIGL